MQPIRVFYDGSIYDIQKFGGINRYFKNLIHHFSGNVQSTLVLRERISDAPNDCNVKICQVPSWLAFQKSLRRSLEAWKARKHFLNGKPDIVHATFNRNLTRDYFEFLKKGTSSPPLVVTIYDFSCVKS